MQTNDGLQVKEEIGQEQQQDRSMLHFLGLLKKPIAVLYVGWQALGCLSQAEKRLLGG